MAVTLNWATPLGAVKTWIEGATGLKVRWRDDAQKLALPNEAFILLHVTSVSDYGIPIADYEYDGAAPIGERMIPRQHALTRVVIECSARAFSAVTGVNAQNALSQLIARSRVAELKTDLEAGGISLCDVTPITTTVWEHENRTWSQYTTDMIFSVRTFWADDSVPSGEITGVPFDEDSLDLDHP